MAQSVIGDAKVSLQELSNALGDWKAGLSVEKKEEGENGESNSTDTDTESSENSTGVTKGDSSEGSSGKAFLIPNGDFEDPVVGCLTMSCANRTTTEASYGTKQTGIFTDWEILSGVAGVWRTNLKKPKEEQNQYLDLTGVIEQEIEAEENARYLLTFSGGANTVCNTKTKEQTVTLNLSWNGEQVSSKGIKNKNIILKSDESHQQLHLLILSSFGAIDTRIRSVVYSSVQQRLRRRLPPRALLSTTISLAS